MACLSDYANDTPRITSSCSDVSRQGGVDLCHNIIIFCGMAVVFCSTTLFLLCFVVFAVFAHSPVLLSLLFESSPFMQWSLILISLRVMCIQGSRSSTLWSIVTRLSDITAGEYHTLSTTSFLPSLSTTSCNQLIRMHGMWKEYHHYRRQVPSLSIPTDSCWSSYLFRWPHHQPLALIG